MHWAIKAFFISAACTTLHGCSDAVESSQAQHQAATDPANRHLVRGNFTEPSSLDPHKLGIFNEIIILQDLFEGLLVTDIDGEISSGVAISWSSSDLRTYTFQLRDDARWSNGDLVTPDDFVYAWRRAIDPKTASSCAADFQEANLANATAVISGKKPPEELGIKAIDEHTLEVKLEQPLPYFKDMIASSNCFYPLHQKTVKGYNDQWTRPAYYVSNGPFKLSQWNVNESVILQRNTNYWDSKNIRIDRVSFLPISSLTSELNRYRAGDLDVTYSTPVDSYETIYSENGSEIKKKSSFGIFGYEVNGYKYPFNDADVRRALAYALDREMLSERILKKGAIPTYTHTPNNMPLFPQPDLPWKLMSQEERETEAQLLYRDAGFTRENPIKIKILSYKSDAPKRISLAVATMWKDVLGAEVELEHLEIKSLLSRIQAKDFDLVFMGPNSAFADPSPILNQRLSINSEKYGYQNKNFDAIMQRAAVTADTQQRAELYKKAEEILAQDMPFIPLFQKVGFNLVKPYVNGYPDLSAIPPKSKFLWIDKELMDHHSP